MKLLDRFLRSSAEAPVRLSEPRKEPAIAPEQAQASLPLKGQTFRGLDDPALLEYMRSGDYSRRVESLRNMAALRCVSLIVTSLGMLPLNLIRNDATKALAKEHPGYRLMKLKPNGWQTPFEFKSMMQLHALDQGNAYARVIWSAGRPIALVPMALGSVQAELVGWQMRYTYTRPDGQHVKLSQKEVFHLRDITVDGVEGIARMKLARDAIALARDAERAAGRVFRTGNLAGGAVEVPKALSDTAYDRMRTSLDTDFAGAENAERWMLLEEGAKANKFTVTSAQAQHFENRNAQIEEVARAFGVPRPLLMMDDTSWGSGIEQLGIFFVQYGLQFWFTAWEQAAMRTFLSDEELDLLSYKFNERALMRGTLKDQADYFAKASGSGGHAPWMWQNEIRDLSDLPASDDPQANSLRDPMAQKGKTNELDATT
ncbi:phage portal protein [Bordetella bronchiseptica]|uniref:phage portal protein n=1 Tax=Bordetella bronchiseptica TaxID=518 RepID=UPI00046189CA|nr:phage portal protein [Bordetella bronchiseptica]KDD42679.1 phage portal-like protein [Bordetella bronchiseptica MBORD901]